MAKPILQDDELRGCEFALENGVLDPLTKIRTYFGYFSQPALSRIVSHCDVITNKYDYYYLVKVKSSSIANTQIDKVSKTGKIAQNFTVRSIIICKLHYRLTIALMTGLVK